MAPIVKVHMHPFHHPDLINFGEVEVGEKLLWRRQEVAIGKQRRYYDEKKEDAGVKRSVQCGALCRTNNVEWPRG